MIQIKSTSTLLFAVLLTGWVHLTSGQPPFTRPEQYNRFLNHLEQDINALSSSPDALPFGLNDHAIENLMYTSDEFKGICLLHVDELSRSGTYSPVMVLEKAVNHIFSDYMRSVKRDTHLTEILEKIKSMDPIGFNVYLTLNTVGTFRHSPSRRFAQFAIKFQATTSQRVRLLNMKTNDSFFDICDESDSSTPHHFFSSIRIPPIVRDEIATEYRPLSEVSINSFANLSQKMCRVEIGNLHNYQQHFSSKLSDVQILYDIDSRETSHAICIFYKPFSCMVHVYDSLMRKKLDDWQNAVIQKLYPFKQRIIFKQPKTVQDKSHPTGAIFAITYASMLLLGEDPAKTSIKLNKVVGDETLYMRIHILNMLANRKLALSK